MAKKPSKNRNGTKKNQKSQKNSRATNEAVVKSVAEKPKEERGEKIKKAEVVDEAKKKEKQSRKKSVKKAQIKDAKIETMLKKQEEDKKKEKLAKKERRKKRKRRSFKVWFRDTKERIKEKRAKRYNPHYPFKRSYREDYVRETDVPGVMYHIFATFRILFKNWKLFLPFLIIVVVLNAALVGLMSEASYQQFQDLLDETTVQIAGGDIGNVGKAGMLLISTITTGGLSGESSESAIVFSVIILLIMWLVTIFLLRHLLAGHKVKLRDGFYNALTPLISTFVVFAIGVLQCIPIFFLIIVYSAAVQTDFLATPFYALVFFIFAALMILISGYLLSSSIIALVAVSAPGLYPIKALRTASDLMMGRRVKFIIRLVAVAIMLVIVWVLVMLPLILFDLWMKTFDWAAEIPFVPVCLASMTCFTVIYVTAYLYLYYRWMLKTS